MPDESGTFERDEALVFLDEIWKAGHAIQNSLLTVLNEKIYLNGNPVTSSQVYAAVCRYPDVFVKEGGRILLMM